MLAGAAHLAHDMGQGLVHLVQGGAQLGGLVAAQHLGLAAQIALGHAAGQLHRLLQGAVMERVLKMAAARVAARARALSTRLQSQTWSRVAAALA